MIILLDDILKLGFYVDVIPPIAYDLVQKYQSPLTIIYPKAKNLADNVIDKEGSVAIRIVKDEFCKRLINLFNKPIVSTSANISGEETPITFSRISDKIKDKMDYIVEYGQDYIGQLKASTIIKISERGDFKTIRK